MNEFALNLVSAIANLIVATVALVALFLAWRQISVSRELSALEAYENYYSMCLQYPHFSSGAVDFEKFNAAKLRQYEIYVLYTLMMDERIFALFPNDKGWIYSIEDDIRMHLSYISSLHFSEHLEHQNWKILPIIQRVIAVG